jgi:hypothetical protein
MSPRSNETKSYAEDKFRPDTGADARSMVVAAGIAQLLVSKGIATEEEIWAVIHEAEDQLHLQKTLGSGGIENPKNVFLKHLGVRLG